MSKCCRFLARGVVFFCLLAIAASKPAGAADLLAPGFRPVPLGVHALVGGTVVVKPGETIEGATIILRDGLIKQVGKGVAPPEDARVWDMKGLTIYAGFIDPYLVLGGSNAPVTTTESEPFVNRRQRGRKFLWVYGTKNRPRQCGSGLWSLEGHPGVQGGAGVLTKGNGSGSASRSGIYRRHSCSGQRDHSRQQRPRPVGCRQSE